MGTNARMALDRLRAFDEQDRDFTREELAHAAFIVAQPVEVPPQHELELGENDRLSR